jgi:hypothetical protein
MTQSWPHAKFHQLLRLPRLAVLILAVAVVLISGCAEKKARAYPWATAIQVRPVLVSVKSPAALDAADLAPDLRVELPPPPSQLEGMRTGPARPRVASSPTDSGSSGRDRSTLLAPQLTPQEVASAQQQFNESLRIVERNLRSVHGRNLNALQSDLLSKVTSFMTESQEAASQGDWTRACTLAKKAEVLSEELVNSL